MKQVVVVDSDLEDLIPGFLAKRQEDIAAVLTAIQTNDYETIRIIGHTLKGIGGGYGFDQLTELGAALELAGKRQEAAPARELVQAMKDYLAVIEIKFE
ncbi:hypothetical protein SRRS_34740 [Sporomusa rhizae]|uniref:Hpt domain-containing protein n=1 Tax=Sporomusa rhizae TaxID=357999 RepID=UPI003529EF3E